MAAIEQTIGIGRRKNAVARVYLRPGKGQVTINGQGFEEYFGKRLSFEETFRAPFKETQTLDRFDVVVNVQGGGVNGQIEAIRHGISRALQKGNTSLRPILKGLGFLTRDAREKERRKYGLAKARKAYQFSKR